MKVVTAREAAALLRDGWTVAAAGFGGWLRVARVAPTVPAAAAARPAAESAEEQAA